MMKLIKIILFIVISSMANSIFADNDNVTIVQFTEREDGIEPYQVRYIIANDLLRIDDNNDDGDYIVYDDRKRIIYSVNHDDSTILVIKYKEWAIPKFDFKRNVTWKKMDDAPAIENNPVYSYWLSANEKICSEAQVAKGFLVKEAQLMKRYQQTLSAVQVDSLVATPKEMRTPCLLIDKVYNLGNVYDKGFPLQQWHINGLQRFLISYKKNEKVSGNIFELPDDYKKYSIGDDLTFGGRAAGTAFIENSLDQSLAHQPATDF